MTIKLEILNQFKGDIFVETGTQFGDGVAMALECGFKKVYSVEIVKENHDIAATRFINNNNVSLFLGDSVEVLPKILDEIEKESPESHVVFWLDAHANGREDAKNIKNACPVLIEVEQIIKRKFNKTLLIDDMRKFRHSGRDIWGRIKEEDIIKAIKCNETGTKTLDISYTHGIKRNDIMVVKERTIL